MCNKRCSIIQSESIQATSGRLIIKLPTERVCNNKRFAFKIVQEIPNIAPTPVVIEVGDVGYLFINHNENFIYSDQLRAGRVYIASAKPDTTIFKNLGRNLCCTSNVIKCNEVSTPVPQVKGGIN